MNVFNDPEIYKRPVASCPLCGSQSLLPHYVIDRFTPPFKTDRCRQCSFIFMNPAFHDHIVESFYDKDYYRGGSDYSYYDERDAEKYSSYVWNKRIAVIRRYVREGSFLDIGCAFGGFLKSASSFFQPHGIELSDYSGTEAQKLFGNTIHIGTLNNHPFKNGSFSVITMIEVIEHMADPVKSIQICFNLLKPGGLLVLQTANMAAIQAKCLKADYSYFLPGHLSYFTRQNLTGLLQNTGFSRIKVFHPVEFGLLPKLMKSRYGFITLFDYRRWLRIALYHYISTLRLKNWAATSSMVLYAFK